MAAPKGNQYAVGSGSGRPRTTTPPDEELIKLGEELVAWATEDIPKKERPYRFRFAQWYSLKKGILDREWELMKQKDVFRGYYERARVALSNNLTDGTIKEGIAHRFMRTYCVEVREEEDETAKFNSSLRANEATQVTKEDSDRHDALMRQISLLQEEARKISDSKRSTDNKS